MHRTLHIIPARGGSKRIPRKNLAKVGGQPLIYWTIAAAISSKSGDVAVSTEDSEIAEYARSQGAMVIERPPELATDTALGMDVALHAARWGRDHGYACMTYLQPTSPLRSEEDIRTGCGIMLEHSSPVVGVTERREVLHAYLDGGSLTVVGHRGNRQTVRASYAVCGAFYGAPIETLCGRRTWYTDSAMGLLVPSQRALDVDTEWDLHVADLLLRERGDK